MNSKLFILFIVSIFTLHADNQRNCRQGIIKNLDPSGDNFLAVRSKPSSSSPEIDRLYGDEYGVGPHVYICDSRISISPLSDEEIPWFKIYYGPNCDIYNKRSFCKSGWAFGRYIAALGREPVRNHSSVNDVDTCKHLPKKYSSRTILFVAENEKKCYENHTSHPQHINRTPRDNNKREVPDIDILF